MVLVLMGIAAIVFGWRPGRRRLAGRCSSARCCSGTAAFAGLGLALAGTLRAEATLALANALFLGCLLLGGIVLPVDHSPAAARSIGGLLPAGALVEAFRVALGGAAARPVPPSSFWRLGRRSHRRRRSVVPVGVTARLF